MSQRTWRAWIATGFAITLVAAAIATAVRSPEPRARPTPSSSPSAAVRPPELVLVSAVAGGQLDISSQALHGILAGTVTERRAVGLSAGPMRLVASAEAARWLAAPAREMSAARIPTYLALHRRTLGVLTLDQLEARARVVFVDGDNPVAKDAVSFVAVGDILLSRHVNRVIRRERDWAYPFRRTARRIASYDLAFANLETSVSSRYPVPASGTTFVSDPRSLAGPRLAGIDALSLANNHATNFGLRAFTDTLAHLKRAGIDAFGGGTTAARAHRAADLSVGGTTVALLGYNTIVGSAEATRRSPGVAFIHAKPFFSLDRTELADAAADVRREKAAGKFVIVYPHWGVEYRHEAIPDQVRIAHALIDAGADAVIGTHAHWVQGMEFYRGKLIAYALGNFVFDQSFEREVKQGIVIEGLIRKGRLVWINVVPVGIRNASQPRFLSSTGTEGRQILRDVYEHSRSPEFTAPT